jgi:hypothetical protein
VLKLRTTVLRFIENELTKTPYVISIGSTSALFRRAFRWSRYRTPPYRRNHERHILSPFLCVFCELCESPDVVTNDTKNHSKILCLNHTLQQFFRIGINSMNVV